jgi:hypothetical protein
VENNVPMAFIAIVSRKKTTNSVAEERLVSTCIDRTKGVFDPVVYAAASVIDIRHLPADEFEIIDSLCRAFSHKLGSASECARQNDATTEDNQSTH